MGDTNPATPTSNGAPKVRRCAACKADKAIDDFAWHNRGTKLKSRCRLCQATYDKEWRVSHPEMWHKAHEASRQRHPDTWRRPSLVMDKQAILDGKRPPTSGDNTTLWLWRMKIDTPCSDCLSRYHPAAMDFDHLRDKYTEVALLSRNANRDRLIAEMAKCEMVCVCCHRVRTEKRGQYSHESAGGRRISKIVVVEISEGGKVCTQCDRRLREEDFPLRPGTTNKRRSRCRECAAGYQRTWHEERIDERTEHLGLAKAERIRIAREFVDALKRDTPCADCGKKKPLIAVDFDHVDGSKEHNISAMVHAGRSLEAIKREIAKCEVVCACCHRIRTYTRTLERKLTAAA